MVFCGKASLSCQNCRIRRIKCNKLQPECSQCTRAGKKCPGYRDQLSLMFRDETGKVRKKFQGSSEVDTPPSGSGSGSSSGPESDFESAWQSSGTGPASESGAKAETDADAESFPAPVLIPAPNLSPVDRGMRFYIEHYVLGQADEPRGLTGSGPGSGMPAWMTEPAVQAAASAIGLAGLSNVSSNTALRTEALQQYGVALKHMGRALTQPNLKQMPATTRSIGLLALFELVSGAAEAPSTSNKAPGSANLHVSGAAALLRGFLPLLPPTHGFRVLMQYLFSMLIPCHAAGTPVPPIVIEEVSLDHLNLGDVERSLVDMLRIVGAIVNLSSHVRRTRFVDDLPTSSRPSFQGKPGVAASEVLLEAQKLDARLSAWIIAARQLPYWRYSKHHTTSLPPAACYHGYYYRYADGHAARIWGFCRWSRILVNQMLLEMIQLYPVAAAAVFGGKKERTKGSASATSAASVDSEGDEYEAGDGGRNEGYGILDDDDDGDDGDDDYDSRSAYPPPVLLGEWSPSPASATASLDDLRRYCLGSIRRATTDTFITLVTIWRHPSVSTAQYAEVASPLSAFSASLGGGSGAIGLPPVLYQLYAAACAPGVPIVDTQWALGVVEIIWRQMGMRQACALADGLRAHLEAMQKADLWSR